MNNERQSWIINYYSLFTIHYSLQERSVPLKQPKGYFNGTLLSW
jgi:hypothetical protein